MRKVIYFKEEAVYDDPLTLIGHMVKVKDGEGVFLEFSIDTIPTGYKVYRQAPVALIEKDDGTVITLPVDMIQFCPSLKQQEEVRYKGQIEASRQAFERVRRQSTMNVHSGTEKDKQPFILNTHIRSFFKKKRDNKEKKE